MKNFIGREKEFKILEKVDRSHQSEFIAVYGRRRVGKTFLIKQYYGERIKFHLTALALTARTEQQLENFHIFHQALDNVKEHTDPPKNWLYAFHRLRQYLEKQADEKKVVFIDELPWFDTHGSDFLLAIEHFWNSWAATRDDIILVVCGSAASWMIDNLINNRGGLYNRITERIHVYPFNLREAERLLKINNPAITRYQIIQLYMVMGGIPFYLKAVNPAESATQAINRLCFEETGLLRMEFANLYLALFENAEQHNKIVRVLAAKSTGLTRQEIIDAAGLSNGGGTTKLLEELEQSGFIRRYVAFGKKKKDSLYQLIDFYTLFYLKFIEPSNPLDKRTWLKSIDHPRSRAWSGYAYEQICLYHADDIKKAIGIDGVHTAISSWRSKSATENAQIDLVIDRRDQTINLCEIKFTIKPYTISKSYAANLRNKIGVFHSETGTNKALHLVFITTYGMKDNRYLHSLVQNDLTMDIFFE